MIFFTSVKFCGQTGNVGGESRDEGKVKGKLKKACINGAMFRSLIAQMLGVSQSTGVLGLKWSWLVEKH